MMTITLTKTVRRLLILVALAAALPLFPGAARPMASAQDDAPTTDTGSLVLVASDEPSSATPRGPQVLRLAGPSQGPESLDPALARDLQSTFFVRQVFRGLTRLDADLVPVPELAERIEVAADGLEYRFLLRADAVFQDGRPITADDVAFSLARALDPRTAGDEAALLAGPTYLSDIEGAADLIAGRATELTGVRVVDERTLTIRLAAPRASFLMKLAGSSAVVVDRNQVGDGEWWRVPNGSGPFRLAEWVPEDHLVLTRADAYWGGTPPLERVEVRLGPNAFQPYNLYEAGEVDVAGLPIEAVDRVLAPASPTRDEVVVTPLFAVGYIAFRADVPPMDDPHIRRAVQLAFPRDKVAAVSFNGHVAAASGPVPPGMLGREWSVDAEPYDLEAARREIAASRYGSAAAVPPLRVYGADYGGAAALREVLEEDLGLAVEVISVDWPEYNDGLRRRSYPAYELYWGADYPDPESILWSLFGSDSADNYIDYRNAVFDDLLRAAAEELDPERRAGLYAQAQQTLVDDHVVLPLYHDVGYTLARPYVKGLEITALGILRLDSVWLEHEA